MPCYLFTYHGHGTWMPDHKRGFVRRKRGVFTSDARLATCYRRNMKTAPVCFDADIQHEMIAALLEAFPTQETRGHAIATDSTHLHVLVSWSSDRTWEVVRRKLRESLSRRLSREVERREWFSKQPSRKRVKDRRHFDYLMKVYLMRHRGLKWREDRGVFL